MAGDEETPSSELGAGTPNLLAVYDPFVAVSCGLTGEPRQVRSGVGL